MSTLYEQPSPGVSNKQQLKTESNDNFLATLAEDNANSLPPVCDETITQSSIDISVHTIRNVDDCAESASDSNSLHAIAEDIPNGMLNEIFQNIFVDDLFANLCCCFNVRTLLLLYIFSGNSQDTKVSDSCLDSDMVC